MNIFHNIDDKSDFSNTKMSQKVKSAKSKKWLVAIYGNADTWMALW
jgi:hypothetical protein